MHIYSPQSCTARMLPCISGILNTNADVMHAQTPGSGQHNIERMKLQAQKSNVNTHCMYLQHQHIQIIPAITVRFTRGIHRHAHMLFLPLIMPSLNEEVVNRPQKYNELSTKPEDQLWVTNGSTQIWKKHAQAYSPIPRNNNSTLTCTAKQSHDSPA